MRTHALATRAIRDATRPRPAAAIPGVRAILRGARVQAKLRVGATDDPAEREADRIADRVMRMPEPSIDTRSAPVGIQRLCAECEEDVQRQPMQEEDELLQAKEAAGKTPSVTPNLTAEIAAMRGAGQPLSISERAFFEPRFGADLSAVRLHTGPQAGAAARALDARAFTVGHEIAFAPGERAPGTPGGDRLMAHELAHVLQRSAVGSLTPAGGSHTLIQRIPKDPSRVPFDGEILPWEAALRRTPKIPEDDAYSNIIADLPKGHRVRVLGGNTWIFVRTHIEGKDLVGYVSHELIREVAATAMPRFTTNVGNPISIGGIDNVVPLEYEKWWMERRGLTTKVRRIPNTATNSYNCHGFVYLDATVWLNDPTPVIRDNKYFVPQKPEVGDAVVYSDTTPTLDKDRRPSFAEIPPHSGLVTKGSPGNPTEVTSKWGSWHVYQHRPADVWTGYGRPTFLRSARAGGHTAEGIVPYDIKVSFSGRPGANAILRQFVAPRAFTLPAGLIPSQGRAGTAPAARADLDIRKNGASIGTISFAASSNAATFTFAREVTFAPGDRLAVIAPGSQDASLAEISITLQGTRSYR